MKRLSQTLFVMGFLALFVYGSISIAKFKWRGETLSVAEVRARWGSELFDAAKFKAGDYKVRAKMAASILKDKPVVGMSIDRIRPLLGNWDGYYFNDAFPAYIIQDGQIEHGETWQLVFVFDQNRKIKEIFVNKN